jgi:hypothetical protein
VRQVFLERNADQRVQHLRSRHVRITERLPYLMEATIDELLEVGWRPDVRFAGAVDKAITSTIRPAWSK